MTAVNPSGSEPICPICATPVEAVPSRCSVCTVRIDGLGRAAGWRGGDPVAAGLALQKLKKSKFEKPGPVPREIDSTGGRCGTNNGYAVHLARKEKACGPCKRAHADYRIEYKARKAAAA